MAFVKKFLGSSHILNDLAKSAGPAVSNRGLPGTPEYVAVTEGEERVALLIRYPLWVGVSMTEVPRLHGPLSETRLV